MNLNWTPKGVSGWRRLGGTTDMATLKGLVTRKVLRNANLTYWAEDRRDSGKGIEMKTLTRDAH
jgi:hypothetical protein